MDTPESSKLTILVADGNRYTLSITKGFLRNYGVRTIVEAHNGTQALSLFWAHRPELVILDWELPIIDAPDVVKHLRREGSPNRNVPIIVLTAASTHENMAEARDSGATEFLVKPISQSTLSERVTWVLRKPRPFVQSGEFFGPDRRRRSDAEYRGEERRSARIYAANRNTAMTSNDRLQGTPSTDTTSDDPDRR